MLPGDARLVLERERDQQFDVLVLDAFSGDAIPVHLLTSEAMQIYSRHLKTSGVLAVHISNSYFDLEPVVSVLAKVNQADVLYIPYKTHPSTMEGGQEYLVESSNERHPFKLTGKHNLQNISAAKETLKKLGITTAMFYEAIGTFGGETI